MQQDSELFELDKHGLCLLSLDGGGVRGLSSLCILKGIMTQLRAWVRRSPSCKAMRHIRSYWRYKLIAIMLARLEMDVDECISVYSELIKSIFKKKASWLPISLTGKTKSRFKSAKLESAIKQAIIRRGSKETDLFNDQVGRKCKVFVCTIAHENRAIVRLRSYNMRGELDIPVTITDAALATSAATTFFDPVNIGARKFADGALGANNPVREVEGEASNIWCPDTGDLKPLVKCFVSVGTGNPGQKPIKSRILKFLSQTLVELATETEKTENDFVSNWRQHYDERRYFRFNVEQGLQGVELAEYEKQGTI
ncbi:FabD/lysophospholipase-like protein [Daldinia caldariorum]|uniref:FabD/lysophospholipase-like protein n=1 Tax=Daldinia caldariorum TaxID=326644 RepID=UPI002008D3DF|nr:FabD/lysophospholipase-like protein [Daldinia caldariorum]KAI1472500.1 FabD/lysophospholipase-like protein [Daldinia caldariorum]